MENKIVVDSCCDVTPELCRAYGIVTVPLTMLLGDKNFTDDDALDLPDFMEQMKLCTGKIGSAAPSPQLYRDAFLGACAYAVTLSSNLSGSFASALVGKQLAEEEGAQVHVFDSLSASAAEVLVAVRIGKLLREGLQRSRLIAAVERYIAEMKTYFVLENLDNLRKNGRLGRITVKLISVLNVKPICGADTSGGIAFYSHARGEKQIIAKLADTIEKSGKKTEGESMVIAHCNNPHLAELLRAAVAARYRFQEILVVPTRGISSIYADNKGIVMAF